MTYTKIIVKWNIDLNVKVITLKFLEENTEINLRNLRLHYLFSLLAKILKAQVGKYLKYTK